MNDVMIAGTREKNEVCSRWSSSGRIPHDYLLTLRVLC
jgi:hypothetical protein